MSKLLPSNRKVRHLHGISLRNLALLKSSRPRGQTIDDEYVPTSLSSPSKLLVQKEGRLGHSQSFSDLKSSVIDEDNLDGAANGNTANGSPQKAKGKRRQVLRRRSTLSWSHESPENRQRLLQNAVAERRVDSFFTIHQPGQDGQNERPKYISEVKHKSMNVDFQDFDLSEVRSLSRQNSIVLKVWAARSDTDYAQLIEADVDLSSLVWLGNTLEDFELAFSDNAIIFHMSDGVYTLMDFIPDIQGFLNSGRAQPMTPRTATLPPQETSSFDALMKLKDLTECIEDAVHTQAIVCKQIEAMIRDNKPENDTIEAAKMRKAAEHAAKNAVQREKVEVSRLRNEKARRVQDLERLRVDIEQQRKAQVLAERQIEDEKLDLQRKRTDQHRRRLSHTGQVRRVAQELLDCYPIEPVEGQFLCFTIRDLYLPNAKVFEDESQYKGPPMDSEVISAALGFVAHVVQKLELYLGIPLPYEPFLCGSTSSIFDSLSTAKELGLSTTSIIARNRSSADDPTPSLSPPTPATHPFRSFPLYQQGTQSKRFRWAIYLLNKDIEELMQQSGCKVVDPRSTLANLKYLLSVLASGKGELPGRKVGIVKGLEKSV